MEITGLKIWIHHFLFYFNKSEKSLSHPAQSHYARSLYHESWGLWVWGGFEQFHFRPHSGSLLSVIVNVSRSAPAHCSPLERLGSPCASPAPPHLDAQWTHNESVVPYFPPHTVEAADLGLYTIQREEGASLGPELTPPSRRSRQLTLEECVSHKLK